MEDRWGHLRAAAIGLALLAHGVYALPLPGALTEKQLQEEWRQRDIDMWRSWLDGAGLSIEHATIERWLFDGSNTSNKLHGILKAPFKPVFEVLGTNQAWALFASATTKPERLVVQIQRDGNTEWYTIARRLDPCCTWKEDALRYRRIRGVWDGQRDRMRSTYKGMTKWIAKDAFSDFPDATRVRVHLEQRVSTFPWEPDDLTVEIRHDRVHRREAVEK